MRYPVKLTPDPLGGYVVSFPDIPEAVTQGESEADSLLHAVDALETALDFYFEAHQIVPQPSRMKRGQRSVVLSASVAAKVLLYNEMLRQGVKPAELARRLKLPRQEMTRILDPRHTTKIDNIANALAVLGKQLEMTVV